MSKHHHFKCMLGVCGFICTCNKSMGLVCFHCIKILTLTFKCQRLRIFTLVWEIHYDKSIISFRMIIHDGSQLQHFTAVGGAWEHLQPHTSGWRPLMVKYIQLTQLLFDIKILNKNKYLDMLCLFVLLIYPILVIVCLPVDICNCSYSCSYSILYIILWFHLVR